MQFALQYFLYIVIMMLAGVAAQLEFFKRNSYGEACRYFVLLLVTCNSTKHGMFVAGYSWPPVRGGHILCQSLRKTILPELIA